MTDNLKESHPIQHAMAQLVTGLHERPDKEYMRRKLIAVERKVHQQLRDLSRDDLEEYEIF
ncbi:hypothetical protein [Psychrobium sp. 1_MG-2023]|uniref:hypothetical protein n=1 Tax=Psychrobium sp. 1_MG-2023 TaxID=3062624 RepID=UPI000C32E76F|nr:hypothetical protein [Psychrobium sp. 1_MG-2023]MDP2560775.1 hypothetical protein [Psychrobium sp. 1_MG-2023]PKF56654.1 hypothetical protein CW748_09235 [Alteromonadales bacterium alter-6D02]